ncbi:PREDICTED: uncharacterized protein LOC105140548 isoform X2 [Populus euphratica]|uniref:Uncharacterized protein LOC105140548 isoform X2 n=1 Tax=Populus euphratica TaxID=75702 RepID=A0AAJ6VDV0_POPEU|nr:PREDICTED: uncharacterized protein LOC105140548 isoform X2 [Populus euphratica]
MSAKRSWTSYNLRSFLELIHRYRASSSNVSTVSKIGQGLSIHQGLQLINANSQKGRRFDSNKMKNDKVAPAPVPNPPGSNFPHWAKWILGTILSILLPFWQQEWEKLRRIEEVVEKVATVAEKVSEEVAEVLPENGKLKQTALLIEAVSKATAHDAKLTQDFIHQVDAVKHDIDDLETMVEPVIEKLVQQNSQGK